MVPVSPYLVLPDEIDLAKVNLLLNAFRRMAQFRCY